MRVIVRTVLVICVLHSVNSTSFAGIVGDINNDGHIDLSEAVYALRVASGVYPHLNPSCVLTGKNDWIAGEDYVECDVVIHGNGISKNLLDPVLKEGDNLIGILCSQLGVGQNDL